MVRIFGFNTLLSFALSPLTSLNLLKADYGSWLLQDTMQVSPANFVSKRLTKALEVLIYLRLHCALTSYFCPCAI